MGPRRAQRGHRRDRRYSPRILIVGDGQTEYGYFATLSQSCKRVGGPAICARQSREYGNPVAIVQSALHLRGQDSNFATAMGDRCYCALDVEPHDPSKRGSLAQAVQLAQQNDVAVLLSNPSFEVWLLCHVTDAASLRRRFATPDAADKELRRMVGFGKKELNQNSLLFSQIVPNASRAVAIARDIHQNHHQGAEVVGANASTDVYRLVQYLIGSCDSPP